MKDEESVCFFFNLKLMRVYDKRRFRLACRELIDRSLVCPCWYLARGILLTSLTVNMLGVLKQGSKAICRTGYRVFFRGC
jgi:hypothetical protein